MQYVAWLIDEAWEHRRRRHRSLGMSALAAGVIVVLVLLMFSRGSGTTAGTSAPTPPGPPVVRPSAVLSKSPYLGVNCPVANSVACDRVGLAVWLKRPAVSATATIAGARLTLNWYGERLLSTRRPRRSFDGYLQPAGIVSRLHVRPGDGDIVSSGHGPARVTVAHQMWFGQGEPSPVVQLTIHYSAAKAVRTQLRVPLSPGWG